MDVEGSLVEMDVSEDGMAWTGLMWFRERYKRRAVVTTVMNLRVTQNLGNY